MSLRPALLRRLIRLSLRFSIRFTTRRATRVRSASFISRPDRRVRKGPEPTRASNKTSKHCVQHFVVAASGLWGGVVFIGARNGPQREDECKCQRECDQYLHGPRAVLTPRCGARTNRPWGRSSNSQKPIWSGQLDLREDDHGAEAPAGSVHKAPRGCSERGVA